MTSIKDLKPDKRNARKHNPRNIGMIEKSLQEVGAARSIVIDEDNNILAGNGTIEAAAQAGIEKVKIVEADGNTIVAVRRKGLTEDQKKRLAILDNRTAETAEWDSDILKEISQEIDITDIFTDKELLDIGFEEKEVEEDEIPETPKIAKTVKGDLYELGRHRLLCGDSTNSDDVAKLMDGKRADLLFTSPPYNAGRNVRGDFYGNDKDSKSDGDYVKMLVDSTTNAICVCNYCFVNLGMLESNKRSLIDFQYQMREYIKDILVWIKSVAPPHINAGTFSTRWEYLFVFANDSKSRSFPCKWQGKYSNVIETENNSTNEYADKHKAGFPLSFPLWVIEKMDFAVSVVDLFCGTGTTIIAAEQTGRICYGMEIEPKYCDVIVTRYCKFTGNNKVKLNGKEIEWKV